MKLSLQKFFKYTQKPRAKEIYLLCRGATVYVARQRQITQKPRAKEIYLLCRGKGGQKSRSDRDWKERNPPNRVISREV